MYRWLTILCIMAMLVVGFGANQPNAMAQDFPQEGIKINFQDEETTPPAGYLRDFGQPYGERTAADQGSGDYTYGWIDETTGNPVDLTEFGRNRSTTGQSDLRLATLVHMDHPTLTNPRGFWEIEVPNGTYNIFVAVGEADAGSDPEAHRVNAEGTNIIDDFVPSGADGSAGRHTTGSGTAVVNDGKLTIDYLDTGVNTKLNYIEITPTGTAPLFTLNVNFQDDATTPPSGYVSDFGQPYGVRNDANQGAGEYTYGWINTTTGDPIDMTEFGRNRSSTGQSDLLLATLVHMNHPTISPSGFWEVEVPNGTYDITVAVGEAQGGNDPEVHRINAEGVNIIDDFVPSGSNGTAGRHTTGSGSTTVSDGKLTIDYLGGSSTNTKIHYLQITQTSGDSGGLQTPYITTVTPINGATNVSLDAFVSTDIAIVNPGGGVNPLTLDVNSVLLYPTGNPGQPVAANVNTTGGYDAIVLDPIGNLEPNTQYTFHVTPQVEDFDGASFAEFFSSFTTGTNVGGSITDVEFEVVPDIVTGGQFTSLTIGPDGKLYALHLAGAIHRWDINADGTLANEEELTSLPTAEGGPRLAIGLDFDPSSTADNLIAWVSHTSFGFSGQPDWSGKISRLSGDDLENVQVYVINLPRSARDHVTNSIDFGPDGALYFNQGSNSAMGAPDTAWSNRPERALSAANLRLDLNLIDTNNLPLDAKTEEGGTYDPFADGAPLTVFGSGIRNAYDLVWHSNGQLYIPTNGSAAGGNSPGTPTTLPDVCDERIDGNPYTGGTVPAINSVERQDDFLFRVEEGGYYGHPNPARCEWVLNGGNPTASSDPFQVNKYPSGINPDPNWRGIAFDFDENKSPNGVIEYQSNAFGGALKGKLLVVRYSGGDDIIVLDPSGPNGDISNSFTNIPGFGNFHDPLDLTELEGKGYIYVAEYGGSVITLLRPDEPLIAQPHLVVDTTTRIMETVSNGTDTETVRIQNGGTAPLEIDDMSFFGVDNTQFDFDSAPSLPLVVSPGNFVDVDVVFDPSNTGPKFASLQIESNDPSTPIEQVGFNGLSKVGTGGSNEPSLQWVLDTLDIGVDVGDDNPATNVIHSDSGQQSAAILGDEVSIQSFKKAGSGAVLLELLAVYGPTGNNPVVTVGWYETGDANAKTDLFSVSNSPASNGQSLLPPLSGPTGFDPGTTNFGFYSRWPAFNNRELFSEDALNTFSGAIPHHVRVYELKDENGNVEPNAYVIATEEHISGFDFQDVVFIARNVEPSLSGGEIALENLQWQYPNDAYVSDVMVDHFNHWLAFNKHNDPFWNGKNALTEDLVTLRIHNTSSETELKITGLALGGNRPGSWSFPNNENPSAGNPIVIPTNGSYDLDVALTGTSPAQSVHLAQLIISSSDDSDPTKIVGLGGYVQGAPEGGREPDVQEISTAFGFGTVIVGPGQQINNQGRIETIGEEVISPFWNRADPSKPVYVRQLGAFHSCCGSTATVRMHTNPPGGTVLSPFFTHSTDWGQGFLPLTTGNGIGQATKNPPNPLFGFKVDGEWSDPNRNNKSKDDCNEQEDNCGHHVRFWPVRDNAGNIMPNTFYMNMDYSGINYDFNDNVYLITNIIPENVEVDVAVAVSEWEDAEGLNEPFSYTVTVSNESIFTAMDVTLEDTLSADVNITSATFDGGSCNINNDSYSCDLGSLDGDASVEVTVNLTPNVAGTLSNDAQVTTTSTDSDETNNTASEDTNVVDPANLPGTITIVKEASPETDVPFSFTTNNGLGGGAFELIDDGSTNSGESISINFQDIANPTPAGYLADLGLPYGAQPTGQTHGWFALATGNPIDASGAGTAGATRNRDRSGVALELDTLIHLQRGDCCEGGFETEIYWEIEVDNGMYEVTVSVGDEPGGSSGYDSAHQVRFEGETVFDTPFVGTASNEFTQETIEVEVTDGRLTMDATGGVNTKVNYVVITSLAQANTIVFDNVTPGFYEITEVLEDGWTLDDVVCDDDDSGHFSDTTTLLLSLSGDEDVVCTFINSGADVPPSAPANLVAEAGNAFVNLSWDPNSEGDLAGYNLYRSTTSTVDTGVAPLNGNTLITDTSFVDTTVVNGTTYYYVVIAVDANDGESEASNTADATPDSAIATPCPPISTLPCSQVPVNLPYVLTFDGTDGRLDDTNGVGTGFTMVDPPSARLSEDDPVSNTDVPGYEPTQLEITGGQLIITANKGIQYSQPSGSPSSTDTNSLINGLGVGFDGAVPVTIETSITGLDFSTTTENNPQAGIWFGLNEDNYAKVVVYRNADNAGQIELLTETNDTGTLVFDNDGTKPNTVISDLSSKTITLKMVTDPTTNTVTGYYAIDGGSDVEIGSKPLPASFFAGADHDSNVNTDPVSYAGIFATYRRADTSFDAPFDGFSIIPLTLPNETPVAADDTAETVENVSVNIDVLDNDTDDDDLYTLGVITITGDPTDGDVTIESDNTITYAPDLDFSGEDSFTYTVTDDESAVSNEATVTVTVNEDLPVACHPYSTETCDVVPVSVSQDFCLDWEGSFSYNGLLDVNDIATGFTMVDPPSARLAVDNPVFDANVPGYEPSKLEIVNGQLIVTATNGIQYRDPSTSSLTNSQINALGVGMEPNGLIRLHTTIVNPAFDESSGNNSQQAGLWFGINEDNYAKLVVAKTGTTNARIQLQVEDYVLGAGVQPDEINVDNMGDLTNSTIELILEIDPINEVVKGYYNIDGAGETAVDSTGLPIPTAFIDGIDHDSNGGTNPISFAGIFTTIRRADSDQAIDFAFEEFCIKPDQPILNDDPVAAGDTAETNENVSVNIDVLNNDTDDDDLYTVGTIVITNDPTDGDVTIESDNTVTYTPDLDFFGEDSFTYTVTDDDNATSNEVTVTVTVNEVVEVASLLVEKTGPQQIVAGEEFNYVITVTNEGPDTAYDVVLVDELPGGLAFVSSTPANPTCVESNGIVTCGLGDIDATNSQQVTLTVVLPEIVTNTAMAVALNDVDGDSDDASSTIVGDEVQNIPPVAVAGTDQTVTDTDDGGDEDVTLDGSGSFDVDGTIVSYDWTWTGDSATGESPTATFPVGETTVTLTVTDDEGATDTNEVIITVTPFVPANVDPVADAGTDQTVNDSDDSGDEAVTLDGSGSSDSDGTIVSYDWTWTGDSATGESPTASFPVGETTVTLTVTDDEGATDTDEVIITVTPFVPANIDPVADAGEDQEVTDSDDSGTALVTLDGSGSSDSDGSIVSYVWTNASNTQIATGENTSYPFPVGVHIVTLTVTDDEGATDTDTVTIKVNAPFNDSPVADAGADQTVHDFNVSGDEDVTLDGSGSSDSDGTVDSYDWTWTGGSTTGVSPTITLPLGTHEITLVVTDNDGASDIDTVTVVVNHVPVAHDDSYTVDEDNVLIVNVKTNDEDIEGDGKTFLAQDVDPTKGVLVPEQDGTFTYTPKPNVGGTTDSFIYVIRDPAHPTVPQSVATVTITINEINDDPVADAGADQNVTDTDNGGDEAVTLDGSGSSDVDNAIVSYDWTWTGGSTTGVSPTVTLPVGTHEITLTVTDELGATDTDTVTITVGAGNQPPTADAGADQTVVNQDGGSENVNLNGSGSSDSDGGIVSYDWTWSGGSDVGATPTINLPLGTTIVTLTVTDDDGATDTDTVSITVNDPPVADAGADQTVTDSNGGGELIDLNGSASTDSDGSIVSYVWTEGPTQIATGAITSFTFPVGVHTVTLTVTDSAGATATDTVTITINEPANQPPTASFSATAYNAPWNGTEGLVDVDGSSSFDPDGSVVSYAWTWTGGSATGAITQISLPIGTTSLTLTVTDDDGATASASTNVTVGQDPEPACTNFVIDFETDANGNPLPAGTFVGEQWASLGIHINSIDPNHLPMIFDSSNPTGGDDDLGTPNQDFGGPGVGVQGTSSKPWANSVAEGNLMILSENNNASDPNDHSRGGMYIITFDQPTDVNSVSYIDIWNTHNLRAYDINGNLISMVEFTGRGDNSAQTQAFNVTDVSRLEVPILYSGAISKLDLCLPPQ